MKKCTRCNQVKPISDFYKNKNTKDGRQHQCILCAKQDHEIRAKDPQRKRKLKHAHLKYNFGITIDDYEHMLLIQKEVCAICGMKERKLHSKYKVPMALAVDHDHATGRVRGLLCSDCNMLLGRVESTPDLILKMFKYLQNGGIDG